MKHKINQLKKKIKKKPLEENHIYKVFHWDKKSELPGFSFNKKIVWLFFLFYFLIAFIAIPRWNNKKDFLIFSQWNLFSLARIDAWDLMWHKENKPIFYFRDIIVPNRASNHFVYPMVRMGERGNIAWIRNHRKDFLYKTCQCKQIFFVRMKGSFKEHIIERAMLEIIKKEEL